MWIETLWIAKKFCWINYSECSNPENNTMFAIIVHGWRQTCEEEYILKLTTSKWLNMNVSTRDLINDHKRYDWLSSLFFNVFMWCSPLTNPHRFDGNLTFFGASSLGKIQSLGFFKLIDCFSSQRFDNVIDQQNN